MACASVLSGCLQPFVHGTNKNGCLPHSFERRKKFSFMYKCANSPKKQKRKPVPGSQAIEYLERRAKRSKLATSAVVIDNDRTDHIGHKPPPSPASLHQAPSLSATSQPLVAHHQQSQLPPSKPKSDRCLPTTSCPSCDVPLKKFFLNEAVCIFMCPLLQKCAFPLNQENMNDFVRDHDFGEDDAAKGSSRFGVTQQLLMSGEEMNSQNVELELNFAPEYVSVMTDFGADAPFGDHVGNPVDDSIGDSTGDSVLEIDDDIFDSDFEDDFVDMPIPECPSFAASRVMENHGIDDQTKVEGNYNFHVSMKNDEAEPVDHEFDFSKQLEDLLG